MAATVENMELGPQIQVQADECDKSPFPLVVRNPYSVRVSSVVPSEARHKEK